MIASAPGVMSYVKAGRLRALAVTSDQPSALAPGIPTATSTGLPGFVTTTMTGSFSSPNTPAAIVNRLNQEIVRVLAQPDVKEKFLNIGSETVGSTPEQWGTIMKSEISRMSKLIQDANIKL
jgi:tripartite-type tricarboxylate transporter receptor subunit TctC